MTPELLVNDFLAGAVSQSSGTPANRDRRCSTTVSLSLRLTRFLYGVVSIHGYSRPLPHHTLADTVPSRDCPAVFRLFWHVAQTGGLPNSTAKVSERLFVHVVDSGGLSNNPGYGKNRWPNTTHRTQPNPVNPHTNHVTAEGYTPVEQTAHRGPSFTAGETLFWLAVGNGGPSSAGSDDSRTPPRACCPVLINSKTMSANTSQRDRDTTTCRVTYPVLDELHARKRRGDTIDDVVRRELGME